MEAKLLRDDGSDADVNEEGELYLKGENVSPGKTFWLERTGVSLIHTFCIGYWHNEQANKETHMDGWLRTGDRFRVDENGYFLYVYSPVTVYFH